MKDKFLENITRKNEYLEYLNEFKKELETSSDRGIVLTCGSIMDALLVDVLKSFLVQTDEIDKDLFKVNGTLGNFDSKIKMAYYLGLISKYEVDNLTYLQRVRNRFAHQIVNISFESNDIANICRNFKIPKNGYIPSIIPFRDKQTGELPTVNLNPIKKDTTAKDRFIYTFEYLYINLGNRIVENLGKRTEYNIVYTADMTVAKTIQIYEETLEKSSSLLDENYVLLERMTELLEDLDKLGDSNNDKISEYEGKIAKHKEIINRGEETYEMYEKYLEPLIKLHKYILKVVENSTID